MKPIPIPVQIPPIPVPLPVQLPPLPKVEKPIPIVLPIISGFPAPNAENLQKAYETVFSDENSEKSESESEMGTLDTIEVRVFR